MQRHLQAVFHSAKGQQFPTPETSPPKCRSPARMLQTRTASQTTCNGSHVKPQRVAVDECSDHKGKAPGVPYLNRRHRTVNPNGKLYFSSQALTSDRFQSVKLLKQASLAS